MKLRIERDLLPDGKMNVMIRAHDDEQRSAVEKKLGRMMAPSTIWALPCWRLRYFLVLRERAEEIVAAFPGADIPPVKARDAKACIPFSVYLPPDDFSALRAALGHAGWVGDADSEAHALMTIVAHYMAAAEHLPIPQPRTLDGPAAKRILERAARVARNIGVRAKPQGR